MNELKQKIETLFANLADDKLPIDAVRGDVPAVNSILAEFTHCKVDLAMQNLDDVFRIQKIVIEKCGEEIYSYWIVKVVNSRNDLRLASRIASATALERVTAMILAIKEYLNSARHTFNNE